MYCITEFGIPGHPVGGIYKLPQLKVSRAVTHSTFDPKQPGGVGLHGRIYLKSGLRAIYHIKFWTPER